MEISSQLAGLVTISAAAALAFTKTLDLHSASAVIAAFNNLLKEQSS